MKNNRFSATIIFLSCVSCVQVWGHRPIEAEEKPNHYDHALQIDKPEVSQVYYGALDVERPQVWNLLPGRLYSDGTTLGGLCPHPINIFFYI